MGEHEKEVDVPAREGSGQAVGAPSVVTVSDQPTIPPTGKRQAFRDIRRQLTNEDLASPGVQKLLLDELEQAEADCEVLQGYVGRYHEADKSAAVLEEKLKTANVIEIMFGVGVGIGGAVIGLAPLFWTEAEQPKGYIALGVGLLLSLGATIARVVKR